MIVKGQMVSLKEQKMGTKKFYKGKKWYAWSIYIPDGQEFLSPSSLKLFQFDHNDGSGYHKACKF